MEFEWDDEKASTNLRKHGVAFEDALAVFDDPDEWTDRGKEVRGERRLVTVAMVRPEVYLSVVYTERGDVFRLISARPSSRKERRGYEQRRTHRSP